MDVERVALHRLARRGRQGHLVVYRALVVGVLQIGIVDAAELEQHLDEVRLPLREQLGHLLGGAPDLPHAEVLAIEHLLRADELPVELG